MAMDWSAKVPFEMHVDGVINNKAFKLKGEGVCDAVDGKYEATFVCETGKLPLDWHALAPTLGYGTKLFIKYPKEIVDFYKQCMPEGYTMDRTIDYRHDGTFQTRHTVTMENGKIMNKVKMLGSGFRVDSPVLNNNLCDLMPSIEYTFPTEKGVECTVHHVYPMKDRIGCVVADQTTVCQALEGKNVPLPPYHHTKTHIKQEKVENTEKPGCEKIVQRECSVACMNFELL